MAIKESRVRSACFLKFCLAILTLIQGATISAVCALPCNMHGEAKLHCVVVEICRHRQLEASDKGAGLLNSACGHLDLVSPSPMLMSATVQLKVPDGTSWILMSALPSVMPLPQGLLAFGNRAGPPLHSIQQPFLALPPQNAPPVLA